MKNLFVVFATLLSVSAFAQSSDVHQCIVDNDSTVGMEQCQHDEFTRLDSVLLDEYQRLVEIRKYDSKAVRETLRAHTLFVSERESHCIELAAEREGGTSQGFAKAECLTRRTQLRIDYIKDLQAVSQNPGLK